MYIKYRTERRHAAKNHIMNTSHRPNIFTPTKEAYVYYINGIYDGVFGSYIPGLDFSQFLGDNRIDAQAIPDKEWAQKVVEYVLESWAD